MIAVLDASVAIALVVDEPGSEAAEAAVAGIDLMVPEAFWVEVANALVRKVRLGMISRDAALAGYALLRGRIARCVPTEPVGALAIDLALTMDHPVYDCAYLATALARGLTLLTADRALSAAATEAGFGGSIRLVG